MGNLGADVEALDELSISLTSAARRLSGARDSISGLIAATWWEGDESAAFRRKWRATNAPALSAVADAVAEQAKVVDHQALQQRQTSAVWGWFGRPPAVRDAAVRDQNGDRGPSDSELPGRYQYAGSEVWAPTGIVADDGAGGGAPGTMAGYRSVSGAVFREADGGGWAPPRGGPPLLGGLDEESVEVRRENTEIWAEEYLTEPSDEELADFMLANPGAKNEIIDWIKDNRPEAYELYMEGVANGEAANLPRGLEGQWSVPCVGDVQGAVIGPDGYSYTVYAPPQGDEGATWVDPVTDDGDDGPWQTVEVAVDNVQVGETIPKWVAFIPGMQLPAYLDLAPRSITNNPAALFVYGENGELVAVTGEGLPAPSADVPTFPESADVPTPWDSSGPTVREGAADLILNAASTAQEIDDVNNNAIWAEERIYQRNEETGAQRVVIVYRQVRVNGNGEIEIVTAYGGVSVEGEVAPLQPGPGA